MLRDEGQYEPDNVATIKLERDWNENGSRSVNQ